MATMESILAEHEAHFKSLSLDQLQHRLELADEVGPLLSGEHCLSKYGTGLGPCARHSDRCLEPRQQIAHSDQCQGCDRSCKQAKQLLTCFRGHPNDEQKIKCKLCSLGNPSVAHKLQDLAEEAERAATSGNLTAGNSGSSASASAQNGVGGNSLLGAAGGGLNGAASALLAGANSVIGRPAGVSVAAQQIGAAIQQKRVDTGRALVASLTSSNPDARRPARYGPTFAQLKVLSLLNSEPLFVNPAVSGQLNSKAADRIRAEIDAHEAATKLRESAANKLIDLESSEGNASMLAEVYEQKEAEMRKAANAYVSAEMQTITTARRALALHRANQPGAAEALTAFSNAHRELERTQGDAASTFGSLNQLNNQHREHYAKYQRNWNDAGVVGPSSAGLAYRMRMVAHKHGALLSPGDSIGSIDTSTGLLSAPIAGPPGSEHKWLNDVGARLPSAKDVLPARVATAIDARGAEGSEALAGASASTSELSASSDAASTDLLRPHFNFAGPKAGEKHNVQPAAASASSSLSDAGVGVSASAVAYVHDMTTQMLLHLLPGIIAVTRNRNMREVEAIRKLGLTSEAGIAKPAGAGAGAAAAGAGVVPMHTEGAVSGFGTDADYKELPSTAAPLTPVEVRESSDPAIHTIWATVKSQWSAWYTSEKAKVLAAARTAELNRNNKGAMLHRLGGSRPDAVAAASSASDVTTPVAPSTLYRRMISDACHESCRKYYVPPMERLVDELCSRPESINDVSSLAPEAVAAESLRRQGLTVGQVAASAGYVPLPTGLREKLRHSVPVGGDGTVPVAASSAAGTGAANADAVLLINSIRPADSSNAHTTIDDVLAFMSKQLTGCLPGQDTPADDPAVSSDGEYDGYQLDDEEEDYEEEDDGYQQQQQQSGDTVPGVRFEAVAANPTPAAGASKPASGSGSGAATGKRKLDDDDGEDAAMQDGAGAGGGGDKKRSRPAAEGSAAAGAGAAGGLDVLSGLLDAQDSVQSLVPAPGPAQPREPKTFTVDELRARVTALLSLSPTTLVHHPRAASWLQWGLSYAAIRASLLSDRGPELTGPLPLQAPAAGAGAPAGQRMIPITMPKAAPAPAIPAPAAAAPALPNLPPMPALGAGPAQLPPIPALPAGAALPNLPNLPPLPPGGGGAVQLPPPSAPAGGAATGGLGMGIPNLPMALPPMPPMAAGGALLPPMPQNLPPLPSGLGMQQLPVNLPPLPMSMDLAALPPLPALPLA